MKSKILITGGAGYIGSHAVLRCIKEGHEVIVIDNLSTGHQATIETLKKQGHIKFYKADLKSFEEINKVFEKEKNIECVLHFAALCSVGESVQYPEKYFENNVTGSINLLKAMRKAGITKLVFSSTCAVYGESQYLPVDENHPTNPTNPYGETKLMIEKILKSYEQPYDFNYVALRYFNVCGASKTGIIGDAKNPSPHLMQNAVKGALGKSDFQLTYSQVNTPDKSPIRDYVDVNDLIDAHHKAYKYLTQNKQSQTINLGTGKGFSVLEIVEKVEEILETKLPRNKGETREGEYAAVYANYNKAKEILNWEPKTTLEESVHSLVKWYTKSK